ncbi:hypothetical protein C2G38_2199671 [Gigaspora rosea]|uniref:Nudix hydrolase domain-containing protein n=1 Tax=Gigaspora rosea TaxID=44941 RepID=A0A397URG8_9GLOM|nr:hypothetical protein C2G38_2199671 [Gigaspora rosea]
MAQIHSFLVENAKSELNFVEQNLRQEDLLSIFNKIASSIKDGSDLFSEEDSFTSTFLEEHNEEETDEELEDLVNENSTYLEVGNFISLSSNLEPNESSNLVGETIFSRAFHNTIEITGLLVKDLRVEEGFRAEITYLSGTRPKRVVYYLAQVSNHVRVYTSSEGLHFAWLPLNQAAEKVLYKSMQEVIKQASAFVENNKPPKNSEPQRLRVEKNQINSDREQCQQHNCPEKNGNGFSAPLHSPVMAFENPLYKTQLYECFKMERFCKKV